MPHAKTTYRVLHLEDDPNDFELIAIALRREWPNCEIVQAPTAEAFLAALTPCHYDVILSDFSVPGFDGFTALRAARERCPETPFLFVSGTIGEERAVEALKLGAADYVLKDSAARLLPAIRRAMQFEALKRSRRELEERFHRLAESTTDVFWFADLNPLRIRYVSPAVEALLGLKPDAFAAQAASWLDVIHPDDRATMESLYRSTLASTQREFEAEFRVVRSNGTVRWIYDRGTVERDAAGRAVQLSGVARDITATKEASEQALRAERLDSIGMLASGIAHDLNNALAPVVMGLDLLKLNVPAGLGPVLESIEQGAQRATSMVRQLLGFARGTEGARIPIDPRDALRDIEKLIIGTFPRTLTVRREISEAPKTVMVDPTLLHQALLNLAVNARDAMPSGGVLTLGIGMENVDESFAGFISGARPGRYVVFSVSDTGTGIPDELIAKIFEPFFTTKGPGVGTGLGLASVQNILHSHGGFVRVSSKVGAGSTFRLYFPAMETGSTPPFVSRPRPDEVLGKQELILVVDDEETVRMLVKAILERMNFAVEVAADGVEALAIFAAKRDRIKLVLTDERMPHMNGVLLAQTIRRMSRGVPILAMSGLQEEAAMKAFEAQGVAGFLQKPFGVDQLSAALSKVLGATTGRANR